MLCIRVQKSAGMPLRPEAIFSATAGVKERIPWINALKCEGCIPISPAKAFWLIPRSFNSRPRISPGWTGEAEGTSFTRCQVSFLVSIVRIINFNQFNHDTAIYLLEDQPMHVAV